MVKIHDDSLEMLINYYIEELTCDDDFTDQQAARITSALMTTVTMVVDMIEGRARMIDDKIIVRDLFKNYPEGYEKRKKTERK